MMPRSNNKMPAPKSDIKFLPLPNFQGEIKVLLVNLFESSSSDILKSKGCKIRNNFLP